MTTLTVYANTTDGYAYSFGSTYSTVRSGDNLGYNDTLANGITIGQRFDGGSTYYVYEGFLEFDTSSIPDSATINSVQLTMYGGSGSDQSGTDFTVQVRVYDWGGTLSGSDYIPGGSLSSYTLVATKDTSGWNASGANDFTENGTNFRSNINKTGYTRLVLCSSRTTNNNTPTGLEYVQPYAADQTGTAEDPKLVIDYTAATNYEQSTSGTMGALTGALSAGHIYTKAIAGAISSMTSTITKATNKAISGTFSASGSLSKLTAKALSGTAGALSGVVSSVAVILHQISGTMGALSGTVSDLQTGFGANLTGAIGSMSGSISRSIGKSVSGTLTASGNVFKMNTFRFAIMKAGTVVRKVIQGGRDY